MKTGSWNVIRLAALMAALAAASSRANADTKPNPYDSIAVQNPFRLNPPPPLPDPNEVAKPPPPILATVEVTGIFNIFQKKQVCLEIVPAPGKPVVRTTLAEGERDDAVKVVAIDLDNNLVTIDNAGVVTNVALKTASKTAGAAPGQPGLLIPPGAGSVYAPPVGSPAYVGAAPNLNANTSGRGSPMVAGGTSPITTPTQPVNPFGANPNIYAPGGAVGFTPNAATTYNPGVNSSVNDFRTIPPRTIRQQTIPAETSAPIDPAVQYLNMLGHEAQARSKGIQNYPPTPPIPGLNQ